MLIEERRSIEITVTEWAAALEPQPGRVFVVSGPSGVGKDAVLERLLFAMPEVAKSVSATTRAMRPGETDGVDYHFLTRDAFEAGIADGLFLEHAAYNGQYYGTPRDRVLSQCAQGLDVILKIEVQGAERVKAMLPGSVLVFIEPPSLTELERRLRMRGTDSEPKILERLAIARNELACIGWYDYLITNDDLDAATDRLRAVILAERCRVR